MTLLITILTAIICTALWICSDKARVYKITTLCYMYWGASLMWLVDAIVEYSEDGADFFEPALLDMLNDTYLGICAVILGLLIWIITLFIQKAGNVKNI